MSDPRMIEVLKGRKLNLDNAQIIGTGAMCSVYLLPDDNVVKVLKSTDFKDAEREIRLSKWAFSQGIPTAISYDVVDVDGHPGLVYESLGKGNLRNELRNNPNGFVPIMIDYVTLLKKLNSVIVDDNQLPSIKDKVFKNLQQIEKYLTKNEFEEIIRLFLTIPEDNHLVHGDCHIKNIKVKNGNLYLIDLDTLSVGDPIFELMGLCCCYNGYVNADEYGYNDFFDIDDSVVKSVYAYILNNYFTNISEEDIKENIVKIELLSFSCMLYLLSPDDPRNKVRFDEMLLAVKERLFTVKDLILKK